MSNETSQSDLHPVSVLKPLETVKTCTIQTLIQRYSETLKPFMLLPKKHVPDRYFQPGARAKAEAGHLTLFSQSSSFPSRLKPRGMPL